MIRQLGLSWHVHRVNLLGRQLKDYREERIPTESDANFHRPRQRIANAGLTTTLHCITLAFFSSELFNKGNTTYKLEYDSGKVLIVRAYVQRRFRESGQRQICNSLCRSRRMMPDMSDTGASVRKPLKIRVVLHPHDIDDFLP